MNEADTYEPTVVDRCSEFARKESTPKIVRRAIAIQALMRDLWVRRDTDNVIYMREGVSKINVRVIIPYKIIFHKIATEYRGGLIRRCLVNKEINC